MANEFIKVINAKYTATIPLIDVASAPPTQGLGFGKVSLSVSELANLGSFDFYLNLLRNIPH